MPTTSPKNISRSTTQINEWLEPRCVPCLLSGCVMQLPSCSEDRIHATKNGAKFVLKSKSKSLDNVVYDTYHRCKAWLNLGWPLRTPCASSTSSASAPAARTPAMNRHISPSPTAIGACIWGLWRKVQIEGLLTGCIPRRPHSGIPSRSFGSASSSTLAGNPPIDVTASSSRFCIHGLHIACKLRPQFLTLPQDPCLWGLQCHVHLGTPQPHPCIGTLSS